MSSLSNIALAYFLGMTINNHNHNHPKYSEEEADQSITMAMDKNKNKSPAATRKNTNNPIHIPIGYRFLPSDQELVSHYLVNKVLGRPMPVDDAVREIDPAEFFSQHPADLVERVAEKEWFFFVKLNENYMKKRRSDRLIIIAGEKKHVWRACGVEEPVKNLQGQDVALKLHWEFLEDDFADETLWRIEEFRIRPNIFCDSKADTECVVIKLVEGNGRKDLIGIDDSPHRQEDEDSMIQFLSKVGMS